MIIDDLVLTFLQSPCDPPNRETLASSLVWPSERIICAHVALYIRAQKMEEECHLYMWNIWCIWFIQFLCERQMQHALCMMTLSVIPVPVDFRGTWLSVLQVEWHFFFFWLKYRGSTSFFNCSSSTAEIFHLSGLSLCYTTLCSTGSFSIIFSHLLVLYSFTFFQFIALYPVRSCDSPKTSTGIRLHI